MWDGRRVSIHGVRARILPRDGTPTKVNGALDEETVSIGIRSHHNTVRSCYRRALTFEPTLSGAVTLEFTIGITGHVRAAKVARNGIDAPHVATCIAKAAKRWKFPPPTNRKDVVVTADFQLVPVYTEI